MSEIRWYLAELVLEITIAGVARNVVHRNLTLIRADSASEAYDKSIRFGREAETSYNNPAGRLVQHTFKGISRLEPAVWGVEDGSELRFDEYVGVSADEIEGWIPAKEDLAAFRKLRARPADDTDYSPAEVLAMIGRPYKRD